MQQPRQAVTDIIVEPARLEEIIEVRHQVLRQGQARSSCYYPEDSYKHTVHFAANLSDEIIGCASVYKESHPDFSLKQSWRIRGMAVYEVFQGRNIGTQLLETCVNHAIKQEAGVIWCNAKLENVDFFLINKFKVIDKFKDNKHETFVLKRNLANLTKLLLPKIKIYNSYVSKPEPG